MGLFLNDTASAMPLLETEIVISLDAGEISRVVLHPGEYVIGRDSTAAIHLEAPWVAPRHARLTLDGGGVRIEDLGSTSGTMVNGELIRGSARLRPGQKVQIGTASLILRRLLPAEDPERTLPPAEAAVKRLLPEEVLHGRKYDIGSVVARGGMGEILGAREAATERTVAMKVMLDDATEEDISRFIAEARVTARLEHPNIVPVHELGVDENGQPFYTMKMVRGTTLRKVIEMLAAGDADSARKFSLPALLTVFQKVCDAVAFAHSKGVIHRDLKPENVMLGDYGEVLVMDWGLAKDVRNAGYGMPNGEAGARTGSKSHGEETMAGTILGTPQYMSPEQARGEVGALDERSDIYNLGAILYHILALRTPVTGGSAMEVVGRVGRGEVEPLAPGEFKIQSSRFSIPQSLAAVVRKAMAFERDGRYPSVADLQRDIAAYQGGFATSAEDAGAWKQFTLFLRRHRALSSSVAASLLLVAVLSTMFTFRVIWERNRAERGEKTAAEQRDAAVRSKDEANSVLRFFQNEVLAAPRPEGRAGGKGHDITLFSALHAAEAKIADSFSSQPLVEATIRAALAWTFQEMGEADRAINNDSRVLEIRSSVLGRDHPDTFSAVNALAVDYSVSGQPKEAVRLLEEALLRMKSKLGPDHPGTLQAMNTLGCAYNDDGRSQEAVKLHEETLRLRKAILGADHPQTLTSMANLGIAYRALGRSEAAIPIEKEAFQIRSATLGPAHPDTIDSMNNLALAYREAGRLEEAIGLQESCVQLHKSKYGSEHPGTLHAMHNLAVAYYVSGRLLDSIAVHEPLLELQKKNLGVGHAETLTSMSNLAIVYFLADRFDDAVRLHEQSLSLRRDKLGDEHPETLKNMADLTRACRLAGRFSEAVPLLQDLLRYRRTTLGAEHAETFQAMRDLGECLMREGRPAEAEPLLRANLEDCQKRHVDDWTGGQARSLLGAALSLQQKFAEAEPLLIEGYVRLQRRVTGASVSERLHSLRSTLADLAALHEKWGKPAEAAKWRKELEEFNRTKAGKAEE